MIDRFAEPLRWIDAQGPAMVHRLQRWSAINTGTTNLQGIAQLRQSIEQATTALCAECEVHPLPPYEMIDDRGNTFAQPLADALVLHKRPNAPIQVLLCIHLDTVFPADHPFQTPRLTAHNTLQGPGVLDAKGGLMVMLTALEALDRSDVAEQLGWCVILNTDEEIGSPGSTPLLQQFAKHCHFGMVYEPALPDGSLIGERKGSGNYTVVVRGRSAHAGRAFTEGRNAIHALGAFVTRLAALNDTMSGVTVNVGRIVGGGAVNVVPDLALCRLNVRATTAQQGDDVQRALATAIGELNQHEGYQATLHGRLSAPPKPLDGPTLSLLQRIRTCGAALNLDLAWQSSGGVCDGNRLAAVGLPTIDTLGPYGNGMHSDKEYVLIGSLTERAKLSALFLMQAAAEQWTPHAPDSTRASH